MIIPETGQTPLDALHPWHPIAMGGTIPVFAALIEEWEDRVTVISETRHATQQAARREERFVTPAPEPRFVPADTVIDMRRTDGDRFRPEDTLVTDEDVARWQAQRVAAVHRAEDTGTIIARIDQAGEDEQAREQRSVLRRAWRWARGT